MGEGRPIRRSHAKKCFVCHRNLEDMARKNDDGWIELCVLRSMGDPFKEERLCFECSKKIEDEEKAAWDKYVKEYHEGRLREETSDA
jgi:hypothetical protein